MAVDLSAYLWRKYNQRATVYSKMRRDYSRTDFANDIGIEPKTLTTIMNKDGAAMISFENLRLFAKFFGEEFSREFDFHPDNVSGWDKTAPKE